MTTEWTVRAIIDACGGRKAVAGALELTTSAVAKMERGGIKDAHWVKLIALSGGAFTPSEIFKANERARHGAIGDEVAA